jgi:hypothetical protein
MSLLVACKEAPSGEATLHPTYVELPYSELVLDEFDQDMLADPGIPSCSLADLRPFGWKTVDSGFVVIRTLEDYIIQTQSLYQEGYRDYQQAREEYPDKYQYLPEMSYEEFLRTCNVFPDVDFSQYSLLGFQAMGTGCSVIFKKHVYRDDQTKTILYNLTVIEEGSCESIVYDRNLILVPTIPASYTVDFSKTIRE